MSSEDKKLPSTAWKPGETGNRFGRGGNPDKPKTRGKPVSSLRKTLSKLKALETKSLENIEKSVNGEEVDKECLASSKWVINSVVSVQKACVAEELAVHGIRSDNAEDAQEEKEEEPQVRFSLHQLPTPRDLQ